MIQSRPQPRFELGINEDQVICLQVYEGQAKPYLYKGKAYKRSESSSLAVDQFELKRLVMLGENLYYERLETSETNLSFSGLEKELESKLGLTQLDANVLRTLDLMTSQGHYTNAAALLGR